MLFLLGICFMGQAQHVYLSEDIKMHVRDCALHFSQTDLSIEGLILFDSTSTLTFNGNDKEYLFSSLYSPTLPLLKIGGNLSLEMDTLFISGDVLFTQVGILDIRDAKMMLGGSLVHETEESHLTSSASGAVIKILHGAAGQSINAMGLHLSPSEDLVHVSLSRTHRPVQQLGQNSMARLFSFSQVLNFQKIAFSFLEEERNGVIEPILCHQKEGSPTWERSINTTYSYLEPQNIIQGEHLQNIKGLALFSYPPLSYPSFFTPNGDGIHDVYTIDGLDKYENARLVILTSQGHTVYDQTPYHNDFDGGNLAPQTYYFLFYKDRKDRQPVKKGFFELIK